MERRVDTFPGRLTSIGTSARPRVPQAVSTRPVGASFSSDTANPVPPLFRYWMSSPLDAM